MDGVRKPNVSQDCVCLRHGAGVLRDGSEYGSVSLTHQLCLGRRSYRQGRSRDPRQTTPRGYIWRFALLPPGRFDFLVGLCDIANGVGNNKVHLMRVGHKVLASVADRSLTHHRDGRPAIRAFACSQIEALRCSEQF